MPDSTPIVQLEAVGYRQGDVEILRQIDWTLHQGQHWAILGPNGSGKTTLLRIACGHVWPSSGRVLRRGRRLVDLRQLRRRIGWVSADLVARIPPNDSALETVVTGRLGEIGRKHLPTGGPQPQDYDVARRQLEAIGCGSLATKRFGVLSQGERQQVLYARMRMVDPLLIVLDEPCAGMDPGVRERFLAWLEYQAGLPTGPAIVLITHHVDEIVASFECTMAMSHGRVSAAGATPEVVTRQMLENIYQTPLQTLVESSGRRWPIWRMPAAPTSVEQTKRKSN